MFGEFPGFFAPPHGLHTFFFRDFKKTPCLWLGPLVLRVPLNPLNSQFPTPPRLVGFVFPPPNPILGLLPSPVKNFRSVKDLFAQFPLGGHSPFTVSLSSLWSTRFILFFFFLSPIYQRDSHVNYSRGGPYPPGSRFCPTLFPPFFVALVQGGDVAFFHDVDLFSGLPGNFPLAPLRSFFSIPCVF